MATYTPEQMNDMLVAGARYQDRANIQAAVHLLTYTDITRRRAFGPLVFVESVQLLQADGTQEEHASLIATVRHWKRLPTTSEVTAGLGGAAHRLLTLAVGLAAGTSTDLRENLTGFGHAHKKRVLEAFAIAVEAELLYTLQPTEQLTRLLAFHDNLR